MVRSMFKDIYVRYKDVMKMYCWYVQGRQMTLKETLQIKSYLKHTYILNS
jgi:hypothetical protein